MKIEEQQSLVEYGESIGILVTPMEQCGVHGVNIGKLTTFDVNRAHAELSSFAVLGCAA